MLNSFLFWIALIVVAVVLLVIQISKRAHIFYVFLTLLFMIYIGMVVTITIFPLPIQKEEIEFLQRTDFVKNVYIPFSDILSIIRHSGRTAIARNIGGNIALLMPLSVLLPFLTKKRIRFVKMLFIGLLSSIGIEAAQAIISYIIGAHYKTSSIDDVILNTTGVIIGFALYSLAMWLTKNFQFVEKMYAYRFFKD